MIDFARNYFELFGLPPRYRVRCRRAGARLSRLSPKSTRTASPAASDAERRARAAVVRTRERGYRALRDPVERAQYLLDAATASTRSTRPIRRCRSNSSSASSSGARRPSARRRDARRPHAVGDASRTIRGEAARREGTSPRRSTTSMRLRGCADARARAHVPAEARGGPRCDARALDDKSDPRLAWLAAKGRASRDGPRLMALFQISEPGESPVPHAWKRAVGIDLGTTNSLVATVRNGIAVVLPDDEGRPLLPSIVRYARGRASTSATRRWRVRPTIRRTRSCRSSG